VLMWFKLGFVVVLRRRGCVICRLVLGN
jgi:hypothetical protein